MKWLSFGQGVEVNASIVRSIEAADPYFEGLTSYVTSGVRTAKSQLNIIGEKISRHKIGADFLEWLMCYGSPPETKVEVEGVGNIYYWQRPWSKCLNIGDVVNPPIPAAVLFDYWRPGDPKDPAHNKKGSIIQISRHMKGLSWDIGGGNDLTGRAKRIMRAKEEGKAFIENFLVEHVNNSVHVDCEAIGD